MKVYACACVCVYDVPTDNAYIYIYIYRERDIYIYIYIHIHIHIYYIIYNAYTPLLRRRALCIMITAIMIRIVLLLHNMCVYIYI